MRLWEDVRRAGEGRRILVRRAWGGGGRARQHAAAGRAWLLISECIAAEVEEGMGTCVLSALECHLLQCLSALCEVVFRQLGCCPLGAEHCALGELRLPTFRIRVIWRMMALCSERSALCNGTRSYSTSVGQRLSSRASSMPPAARRFSMSALTFDRDKFSFLDLTTSHSQRSLFLSCRTELCDRARRDAAPGGESAGQAPQRMRHG